jgi:hypothetical protein
MLDTLIKNGVVVHGTGKTAFKADLGIAVGRIAVVARNIRQDAMYTIEARGKVWPLAFSILTPTQPLLCWSSPGPRTGSGSGRH